jgi:CHAT domain-containing protein/Tfp pilus assembly protein PilF
MPPTGTNKVTKLLCRSLPWLCVAFGIVARAEIDSVTEHGPAKSRPEANFVRYSPTAHPAPDDTQEFVVKVPRTTKKSVSLSAHARLNDDARRTMANAEALRATWKEDSLQQAIHEYEKASRLWKFAGDARNASRATLSSGEIYFQLSRYDEAFNRYKETCDLARENGDWLAEANALSQMALTYSYRGKNSLAEERLNKALKLFKRGEHSLTGEAKIAYGEALCNLGEIAYSKGNLRRALIHFKEAEKLFESNPNGRAKVHLFSGYIAGSIGNPDKAFVEFSKALDLYWVTNNKQGEARVLTALGLWHSLKPGQEDATALHKEALELFRSIGDRHSEAIVLNALGQAHENLNECLIALNYYRQASKLFQDIGAADGETESTCNIARTHHLNHNSKDALSFYERCLSLSRSSGKLRTEAFALSELANFYAAHHEPKHAATRNRKTLTLYRANGDLRGQVKALNAHGDFLMHHNQLKGALETYRQALPLSEKAGDPVLLLNTLYNLARANADLQSYDIALQFIERSIATIEDLRANVLSPELRISYFSGLEQHYKLCIEILVKLEGLHPGNGYGAQAFMVSERSRARLLLDLVNESQASLYAGASKEVLDRERELRELIRAQAEYRSSLSPDNGNATELADADNDLVQIRTEYQAVQAELRREDSNHASLKQLSSWSLEEIKSELRTTDTVLLEFSLGSERSYLWVLTSDSVSTYELPPRKTVEELANEFYRLLTTRQRVESAKDYLDVVQTADHRLVEVGSKLSQMLLGQVAHQLESKRLVVVPEGGLQYIPFEALPLPTLDATTASKSLLEVSEVVVLPSFSTLLALRKRLTHLNSANKLVAVIADPVFSSKDDRAYIGSSTEAPPYKTLNPRDGFLRLPHTAEEANTISTIAPRGTTMMVKGFDATREMVTSPEVTRSQIVHLATHGYVDNNHPELSGIVLTMIDRQGMRINGLMSLHDIYNLDLGAELTVLSACQTALGKDINGEGFVGLNHAFMSAGSKTVIASLWKVDDRATAALMADFYHLMLRKGLSPSAALRSAKIKMARHERWGAPYYWAGFILQGEYTNQIVLHKKSPRMFLLFLFFVPVVSAGLSVFTQSKNQISP